LLAPVGIGVAGYFPGKRLGVIADLPAAAMWQWRRWCLHPDYLALEGPQVVSRYARVTTPITAVLLEDDELLSPAAVRDLYRLYAAAPVSFVTPRAHDFDLKRIGHFGFFQPIATGPNALWHQSLQWILA
jgi:predicted alpha/beta hydrolase